MHFMLHVLRMRIALQTFMGYSSSNCYVGNIFSAQKEKEKKEKERKEKKKKKTEIRSCKSLTNASNVPWCRATGVHSQVSCHPPVLPVSQS